jgi:DnaD/phage-associated family protein
MKSTAKTLTHSAKCAKIIWVIAINYKINWAAADGAAAMPKSAADCLKLASGIAAKVFIFFTANDNSDAEEIAEALGILPEDAADALMFWERAGVLERANGETARKRAALNKSGKSDDIDKTANTGAGKGETNREKSPEKASLRKNYSPDKPIEIAAAAKTNRHIAELLSAAEKILGRVPKFTETRVFTALLEELNLSPDILIMIIDFAKKSEKYSASYIDTVARDWAERGITSHSDAETEILKLTERNTLEGQIKSRFGLSQALSKTQKNYVRDWADKGFTIEAIMTAFDITVDRIQKADFKYISKVLTDSANDEKSGSTSKHSVKGKSEPSFSYGDFGEKTIEEILKTEVNV